MMQNGAKRRYRTGPCENAERGHSKVQNVATQKCRTGSPDIPSEAVTYRMWRGAGPPYVLLDALFMYFFLDKHT